MYFYVHFINCSEYREVFRLDVNEPCTMSCYWENRQSSVWALHNMGIRGSRHKPNRISSTIFSMDTQYAVFSEKWLIKQSNES